MAGEGGLRVEISVVLVFFPFQMEAGISAVEGKKGAKKRERQRARENELQKEKKKRKKRAAVNANNDGTSGGTSSLLALYFPTGERL